MKMRAIMTILFFATSLSSCAYSTGESSPALPTSDADAPQISMLSPIIDESSMTNSPSDIDPTNTPTDNNASVSVDYSIYSGSTARYDRFDKFGELVIYFPQISIPNNDSLSEKINATILDASTEWVSEQVLEQIAGISYPQILSHSSRYFSFGIWIGSNTQRVISFLYEVTIDMQTGERVMLNDLIDINDEFLDLLYEGSVLYGTDFSDLFSWYEIPESTREEIQKRSRDELLEMLDECSTPLSEYSFDEDLLMSLFYFHGSFHVASGKLYIFFGDAQNTAIMLNLDDIEEFLKVPKW